MLSQDGHVIDSPHEPWETGAMRLCALALPVLLVACAGDKGPKADPDPTAAPTAPAPAEGAAEKGHHEHAGQPAELHAFHEILAPRWHSDPGPARMKATCDAIADFKTRAAAVKAAPAPAGADAARWTDAGAKLEQSVGALETSCGGDQAGFDSSFATVHDTFHAAMEIAAGGGHGEGHGEHGEGHGEHGHGQGAQGGGKQE
jgi:hypothetical protein